MMLKAKSLTISMLATGAVLIGLDVAGRLHALFAIRDVVASGLTLFWSVEFVARCLQGFRAGLRKATGSWARKIAAGADHMKMYVLDRLAMYSLFLLILGATTAARNMFAGTSLGSIGTILHVFSIATVFFWISWDAARWIYELFQRKQTEDVDFISRFIAVGRALREGDFQGAGDTVEETSGAASAQEPPRNR